MLNTAYPLYLFCMFIAEMDRAENSVSRPNSPNDGINHEKTLTRAQENRKDNFGIFRDSIYIIAMVYFSRWEWLRL